MDVTVIVVAYNAAWCIAPCLESLLRQEPHGGALELLVVDGCSEDGTAEAVRSFGARVRLVQNPGRTIASNRNAGLRAARHPCIAFTDADCTAPPHWLKTLCAEFEAVRKEDPRAAAVGGGNVPPAATGPFHAALGIALDSFLGSLGSVQGSVFADRRPVPSLAALNVLYDAGALQAVGGFDEALRNMCEDADANFRLHRAGRTLYYVPGAEVEHHARRDLAAWWGNMYAYGVGRARIMRKHRTVFSVVYLVALLFLPLLLVSAAAALVQPWALLLWLYFPAMAAAGCVLAVRACRPSAAPRVALILLGTHLCYAAGLCRGILQPPRPAKP